MRALWDGILSLLAAVLSLAICGAPVWFSSLAIRAGLVPVWGWAPVVALGAVGLIMTFAFLRKALNGISPARDRRR